MYQFIDTKINQLYVLKINSVFKVKNFISLILTNLACQENKNPSLQEINQKN